MGKLRVFNHITLNGYLEGPKRDISWHHVGAEENDYAVEMLSFGDTLLFGRVTYDLMASYWPTPFAKENDAEIAEGMNVADKIVFSRTLKTPEWANTRLVCDDMVAEVRALKRVPGKNMTILGSGSIVTQLADAGLIDEYEVMVNPTALGGGTPMFRGMERRLDVELMGTRVFRSGNVLLCYQRRGPKLVG